MEDIKKDIDFSAANKIIKAAVKEAEKAKTPMCIAVVDAGGNLTSFVRMDGAPLGSIQIAQAKARTARFANMSTHELGEQAKPGAPLYGIEVCNQGMVIFGGGELIKNQNKEIIGAIGVSGGTVNVDIQVAKSGVNAL